MPAQHGFVGIEFDAMLVTADWEKRSGHGAIAREQLASLERAARDKGFMLVARKAAAAAGLIGLLLQPALRMADT